MGKPAKERQELIGSKDSPNPALESRMQEKASQFCQEQLRALRKGVTL